MGKRVAYTPVSVIKNACRKLFLWSRESTAVRKRDGNTCVTCGRKQSQAKGREVKIEVHHKREPNWERIINTIREELLQTPEDMICLCKECHKEHHAKERE